MNIISNLKTKIKKTSDYFTKGILNNLLVSKINENIIENLETILLSSDIGIEVTNILIKKIQSLKASNPNDTTIVLNLLAEEIEGILKKKRRFIS